MPTLILGLVGKMGAGKTTMAQYMKERYDAPSFRFSDCLRDILDRLYLPQTRTNMQMLSTILRQHFDEKVLSRALINDLKNTDNAIILVEGIRRPGDLEYLKNLKGFHLAAVDVDMRTRYERITTREENTDDTTKTWEVFQQEQTQESEQKIDDVMKTAEVVLDNSGTVEELYTQVDALIGRYAH